MSSAQELSLQHMFPKHKAIGSTPIRSASCPCLAAKLSEVYREDIDCRQGLVGIRMRRCKEHKDLDRFRPLERNTLRPVWWFVLS